MMKRKARQKFILPLVTALFTLLTSCAAWPGGAFLTLISGNGGGGGQNSFLGLLLLGGSASLTSVEISPASATIAKGTSKQLKATGIYSDGSRVDLTDRATWKSDDETLLTVNSSGTASSLSAVSTGTTTIRAAYGGLKGTASITISSATISSLEITPSGASLPDGISKQYYATGVFSDSSTQDLTDDPSILWSSDDGGVAGVSATGLVVGNAPGSTTLRASYSTASASAPITVSSATLMGILVTPTDPSISDETTRQFKATATFSDSTTEDITDMATWSSGDVDIATVDSSGRADAGDGGGVTSSTGTVSITATYGAFSNSADMTVESCSLSSITVTPNNPIAYGTTQQFKATANFTGCSSQDITEDVLWSSSDSGVASISNAADSRGLASSISAGSTLISAKLGAVTGSTSLTVKLITLSSISVIPVDPSVTNGGTRNFYASGLYSDGTIQDLTTQVLWSSDNTSVSTISNAGGSEGTASTHSVGSATITATREGVSGTSTITVTGDTLKPGISSVDVLDGTSIQVTFSEDMNVSGASLAATYKVVETVSGSCSDNSNFSSSAVTADFNISSVTVLSPSVYVLNFDAGTQSKLYTLVADKTALTDTASNGLDCENTKSFMGQDAVPPYMVSAISNTPTTVVVKFSEAMLAGGGAGAADNAGSYTVSEDPSDAGCTDVSVSSVSAVDSSTYELTLSGGVCAIRYRVSASSVKDANGNVIASPSYLTFLGNEQIKVVSAEALSLTTLKVTFSKPVLSTAACSSISDCSLRYKLSTSDPGNITQAVVSDNTVTLTHQLDQSGIAYTVMVANGVDGDGFDNGTYSLRNASDTENIQSAPKDRATFIGLGAPFDKFEDGTYFFDPFVDGTSFSYAFTYGGRVYLGTNDLNNAAFRFDPQGSNAVLTTFAFSAGSCPGASGFGYNSSGSCLNDDIGPNGEYGVVGFNSATVTLGGTDYEILMVGPIKDGVTNGYFTQDLDTELDWTQFGFSVTGGGNTKSVQTPYAVDNHLYLCMSSAHSQQAPICSHHTVTESGGVVQVASGVDMGIRSVGNLGKQATNPEGGTSEIVGIDSILKFGNNLYMANNGGVYYSSGFTESDFASGATLATPSAFSGTTLVLDSLGKVRPGEKGVPILLDYNGKLYMARNVAAGSSDPLNKSASKGELWKCDPAGGSDATACEPGDWSLIISGTESDLPSTNSISLLKNNGSGVLYVGFDDHTGSLTGGVRIFRIADTDPAATDGSTLSSAGWVQQGGNGMGDYTNAYIFSSATIYDGTDNYIYVTVGDGSSAIQVFRQID